MEAINGLEDIITDQFDTNRIPISTSEQLLKIGSGEEIEINGIKYKFETGKTYILQNDIEYTGNYDNIASLIQNKEIDFEGQEHKIIVTNESGVKEYYTEDSKYYIATNVQGYVLEGLELYYDGIDNAGEGSHSNTASIWKDLSGNNRDGTLNNFGTSAISGWNNEYLSFDGVNDWVNYGILNNENVTLEAVHRLRSDTDGERGILGNWQDGGNGILSYGGTLRGNIYKNSEYQVADSGVDASVYKNKILTQSLTYNGQDEKIYVDGEEKASQTIGGNIEYPTGNTVMAVGGNPNETSEAGVFSDSDVFCIRIYNRGLSKEEIEVNNRADNKRFKQQEIIPVYTEEQLLKLGSGEQVLVEQEDKTYTYAAGAKYELKNDITVSGDYTNIINKINNKEIDLLSNNYKISNNGVYYTSNSKYTIGVNQYGYVANGLQLLYDGIDNTGEGSHSNTTTVWKDLSGNNRDGTLKNMDVASSCQSDGLKLDGIDDFVLIAEMNYDNPTAEVVTTKGSTSQNDRGSPIVANINNGGFQIYQSTTNRFGFGIYISENADYTYASQSWQDTSNNDANLKYSISASYNGSIIKLRTSNGPGSATTYRETEVEGTVGKPTNNTYMVLGVNPTGQQAETGQAYFDGKISSVRIYNRALSDEENLVNYLNDRERYNV